MDEGLSFAPDLYQGTAEDYERFRPGYPVMMTEDLVDRAQPSGGGRLLDLACGTGQLAFAFAHWFVEVWAVDQEPDMLRVVETKAAAAGIGQLRAIQSPAEDLDAQPGSFELVVIGNAFHRLHRAQVASQVHRWLHPGGHLALCWSSSPWVGPADWQQALSETLGRWRAKLGAEGRIPNGWDRARRAQPDLELVTDAGFEVTGSFTFPVEHGWSIAKLIGFAYSTSFLPRSIVGRHAGDFEADLAAQLAPYSDGGMLAETVRYSYDLARRTA